MVLLSTNDQVQQGIDQKLICSAVGKRTKGSLCGMPSLQIIVIERHTGIQVHICVVPCRRPGDGSYLAPDQCDASLLHAPRPRSRLLPRLHNSCDCAVGAGREVSGPSSAARQVVHLQLRLAPSNACIQIAPFLKLSGIMFWQREI